MVEEQDENRDCVRDEMSDRSGSASLNQEVAISVAEIFP